MSLISKMFGAKPKKQVQSGPSAADAIQRLRGVEEMLIKKQEYLEKKIESEVDIIRKNGTKNKRLSLQALKRKKRLESQLAQIDGTLTTLESQRESLENANTNMEVLVNMKFGAEALKTAQTKIGDVDRVEDIMDDIREQQELAQEISDVISNPIGFGHDVDEDELLRELEDMEQEELDQQLLETEALPAVPKQPVPVSRSKVKAKSKVEEDDDLNQLAAWAN